MKTKSRSFIIIDWLLIILAILPLVFGVALNILTDPPTEGIQVTGARVFAIIDLPFQDLYLSESIVNSWLVVLTLFFTCLYFTHGLSVKGISKRQVIAEWIVGACENMVNTNMGEYFSSFGPFIAAIMGLSACSSLLTLIGLYPPTSDINIVGGWAILVFILITYYRAKCGPWGYLKSFGDPVPFLAPLNIISELATPVSMAFRHYGNVLSGSVISVLLAAGLQGLSALVLGWLPGFLGEIPFLQIGIPAILSIYFDIFSGCLQAFIFAMLTMLYIAGAFNLEGYEARKAKKLAKKKKQN